MVSGVAAENARVKVKEYCQQENMKQSAFGEMLGLCKSTFSRFMGTGRETTGTQSYAYPAIMEFFKKQKNEEKKVSNKRKREEELAAHVFYLQEIKSLAPSNGGISSPKDEENESNSRCCKFGCCKIGPSGS
jgi:predicted XRE-type DNA-binding protein